MQPERFTAGPYPASPVEPARYLPVAFVVAVICTLYFIYTLTHCAQLLWDENRKFLAYVQLVAFHVLTLLLVACYVRSMMTGPGGIPDDEEWRYNPRDSKNTWQTSDSVDDGRANQVETKEVKRSGERRHCKWCRKYKPDRCHHCRACRTCVLKMDHHCPWINNCVGFRNHKFFFLLVFYTAADCHFIAWTMLDSARRCLEVESPFNQLFLILFGVSLSGCLAIVATVFVGFHIWLAMRGMSTIEFCEKSRVTNGEYKSPYDEGPVMNAMAVLGPSVLLWLLPVSPPTGDGLTFVSEHSRLLSSIKADPEAGQIPVKRRGHTPTQRDRAEKCESPPTPTPRAGDTQASAAELPRQQLHSPPIQTERKDDWFSADESPRRQFRDMRREMAGLKAASENMRRGGPLESEIDTFTEGIGRRDMTPPGRWP